MERRPEFGHVVLVFGRIRRSYVTNVKDYSNDKSEHKVHGDVKHALAPSRKIDLD